MEKARMSVNLGCVAPVNDNVYNDLVRRMLGNNAKKTKTMVQNKEAKELKKRALAIHIDKRNEYKEFSRVYNLGDTFTTFVHPTKSNMIYQFKSHIPDEEIEVMMKKNHINLPHKKVFYNGEWWIEFYWGFVSMTNATQFTIITDVGIFKVTKSFLINHGLSKSSPKGFTSPTMLSLTTLKAWSKRDSDWALYIAQKDKLAESS